MPDGLRAYLERCLALVPESAYRLRLRQELGEHLADLAEGYLARGYDEGEAILRAMEKLGRPEQLREQYREAWLRQPERWRRDLERLLMGCFLALLGHLLALLFLEHFVSGSRRFLKVYGDPRWRFLAEGVLFAGETLPCLIWLLLRFRRDRTRRAWVTAGLVLVWALDKAMLLLTGGDLPLPYFFATLGASLVIGLVFS
jgi:hypothetical protein